MHTFRTLEDASYYTRETEAGAGETWGYYDDGDTGRQEEAGVWHGELAAAFGLSGRIRKEDFERLMAGQSPSGKKLVRTAWTPEEAREKSVAVAQARRDVAMAEIFARKDLGLSKDDEAALAADPTVADARRRLAAAEKALKHRAGFDYTVSPPKGFSLALETVTPEMRAELDAVFDEAVEEVVQMIQDHSYVRKGRDGANVERSAGIACASFKHRTTRPVEMIVDGQPRLVPDPQIHAHIVIAKPFKLRLDQADVARAFCLARGFLALTAFAGTGKTTSADAVAIAHRDGGFEVVGFAPSGKASDQFAVDTKTDSFTFESFALRFDKWVKEKRAGDKVLFMVDEAGMATLEQFDKMTKQAMELRRRGVAVKILIQGDVRQLPPVGAGAPFAWIVETGAGGKLPEAQRLTDITRQFDDWAKEASYEASMGDFEAACAKYADRGRILTKASRPALVRQMIADFEACPLPAEEKILLAHKNDEVRMLNEMARKGQVAAGKVLADQGAVVPTLIDDNEGTLEIAPGDRIILRKNDRKLGVSNGQLGTVGAVEADGRGGFLATVRVDGKADPVRLPLRQGAGGYLAIERGYACTIHKSQGGTWKEAFMVHSGEGAELSLVAMTRHRAGLRIYTQEADIGRMSRQMSAAAGKANPLDYLGEDEVRALTGQSREGRAVVHVGEKVREATSALDATPRIEPTRIAEEAAAVSDLAAEARRVAADLGQAIANASDRIGRKIKEQRLDRSERRRIAQIEDPKRRAAAQAVLDLMDAARDGDKPKIEALLASGTSPILVDRRGRTAAAVAESAGKRETAEWLLTVETAYSAELEARRAGLGADAFASDGRPAFKGARGPVMDFSKATIFIQEPKPAAGAPAATPTDGPAQAAPAAASSPAPAPPKPIRRPRAQEQGLTR